MNEHQTRGGLRPLPSPTGVGCAGSRTPLAVGRIRLHGLDALPNTWPWRATHLRSLARSGNQLLPARRPVVSRSVGPTSLPTAVPAVGARVGVRHHLVARARRDRGCTPPDDRSVLGHLAVRDRPQSPAPPMACPVVGDRPPLRAVALRVPSGAGSGAWAPARAAREASLCWSSPKLDVVLIVDSYNPELVQPDRKPEGLKSEVGKPRKPRQLAASSRLNWPVELGKPL